MLRHFGCPTPTVDAFASAANQRLPWYWPETPSAWGRSWPKEFIWANLPFEWFEQVVKKFISDKARRIRLLPDYSSTCPSKEAAYLGALDSITLADYAFLPHNNLFLRGNGKAWGPTPWKGGTRALWLDGSLGALPSQIDSARISVVGY